MTLKRNLNVRMIALPILLVIATALIGCGASDTPDSQTQVSDSGSGTSKGNGLAGTAWGGAYSCDNGNNMKAVYTFAASGHPNFRYADNRGRLLQVELTAPGQSFRYIAPGGGVVTVVVNQLSISADSVSYVVNVSEERTRNDILDQSASSISTTVVRSGETLLAQVATRSGSVTSQTDMMVPGGESVSVCNATLTRIDAPQ